MKWKMIFFLVLSATLIGSELWFQDARLDQKEFLTDLGMRANNIYDYRSVSDQLAREVFLVKDCHLSEGIIRLMMKGENLIGFFGLANENGLNILTHFFLEPDYIGRGYGKILFIAAMQSAKEELGWESLQWESDPNAAWFYKKMGAVQIGENPCPLNPKYTAPVFVFKLQ